MTGFDFNFGFDNFVSPITGSEIEGLSVFDKDDNDNDQEENNKKNDKYCDPILFQIQLLYILAGVMWIYLIYFLDLWRDGDIIQTILIALPLIIFGISFYNSCQ